MDDNKNKRVNKSLKLLADGYKAEFAEHIINSEGFCEFLMGEATQFVDEQLSVIDDEEYRCEIAMLLMEAIKVGNF